MLAEFPIYHRELVGPQIARKAIFWSFSTDSIGRLRATRGPTCTIGHDDDRPVRSPLHDGDAIFTSSGALDLLGDNQTHRTRLP
jgi:hypothetical protein